MSQLIVVLAAILLAMPACRKTDMTYSRPANTTITLIDSNNTHPQLNVHAGQSARVFWPNDTVLLKGTASITDGSAVTVLWNQQSGPSIATIDNPTALHTVIRNLKEGSYVFELSAIARGSITNSHTIRVIVCRIPDNPTEKLFTGLGWYCPMGCYILIKNFDSHIQSGPCFKVFIKPAALTTWEEVLPYEHYDDPNKVYYTLENNTLALWHYDRTGDVSIKVVY